MWYKSVTQLKIELHSPRLLLSQVQLLLYSLCQTPTPLTMCLLLFNVTPSPTCWVLQPSVSFLNVVIKKVTAPQTRQHQRLLHISTVDLGACCRVPVTVRNPDLNSGQALRCSLSCCELILSAFCSEMEFLL